MSKKRTSPDSSDDEQTNEGLDSVFQQDGNTKRARLASLLETTTLQDLPMELIEYILIKAVTMEMNDMKLAKSVWKEKCELVISRLRTVCSQWSHILTNNFFRNELQRFHDALEMVRIEISHQCPCVLPPNTRLIMAVISTMNQVFMVCKRQNEDYYTCNVYDRNNMEEVKDVIPLPGRHPPKIAVSSSESNCVHVICREMSFRYESDDSMSILRIAKDAEQRFTASPLITNMWLPSNTLVKTPNGSLIFSKQLRSDYRTVISIGLHDTKGLLQHEIKMPSDIWHLYQIIPRPNGNLVLVSASDYGRTKLTEIDMDGNVLRQYQSSIGMYHSVFCDADKYGRIVIAQTLARIELLDSEFNLIEFTGPQLGEDKLIECSTLHYNRKRNEIVTIGPGRTLITLKVVF